METKSAVEIGSQLDENEHDLLLAKTILGAPKSVRMLSYMFIAMMARNLADQEVNNMRGLSNDQQPSF